MVDMFQDMQQGFIGLWDNQKDAEAHNETWFFRFLSVCKK